MSLRQTFCAVAANVLAVLPATLPSPAVSEEPALPGIVRQSRNIYLMENHSNAYVAWLSAGVTNRTVVHLDTHDDFRFVPPEKLEKIAGLKARHDHQGLYESSDLLFSMTMKRRPDTFLFDLGNFIYPAMLDGTIASMYWVVPDRTLSPETRSTLRRHMATALGLAELTGLTDRGDTGFSFDFAGRPVSVTTLDGLPQLPDGAILDIDVDFFAFPTAMSDNHLTGKLAWDPREACRILGQKAPSPYATTICASVWGGYLPLRYRFLSDAIFEYFLTGTYPDDAVGILDFIERMQLNPSSPPPLPPAPVSPAFQPGHDYANALLCLLTGRMAEAEPLVEKAVGTAHVFSKGFLDFAEAFLVMRRPDQAHRMIDSFERVSSGPTLHSRAVRSRVLASEGRLEDADKISSGLAEWDPSPYMLLIRGGILTDRGMYRDAEEIYKRVISLKPGSAAGWYNMGIVAEKTGDPATAVRHYETAIRLQPGMAPALENLGHILLRSGKPREAVPRLAEAARLDPLNVISLNNLGLAFCRLGKPAEGLPHLLRAIDVNSGIPELHGNAGMAFMMLGKKQEALAHYENALALKPDSDELRTIVERLRQEAQADNARDQQR